MGESVFPGEREGEGEGEGEGEERLSQNMHFCRKVESGTFTKHAQACADCTCSHELRPVTFELQCFKVDITRL